MLCICPRSFASQAEPASLFPIVLLGGLPVGSIDRADHVSVDSFTKITNHENTVVQRNFDWQIDTSFNVGVVCIAHYLTNHCFLLVRIQGRGQHVEER